jgi:hypothetical protein
VMKPLIYWAIPYKTYLKLRQEARGAEVGGLVARSNGGKFDKQQHNASKQPHNASMSEWRAASRPGLGRNGGAPFGVDRECRRNSAFNRDIAHVLHPYTHLKKHQQRDR